MTRRDLVYNKLIELNSDDGVDANTISSSLGISRSNVSHELNVLCKEGKVLKTSGRPVRFFIPSNRNELSEKSSLDEFVKNNISLKQAVEQLKAAILYPPHGMNCLILGNTGVGKSMFASLMHEYAVEMNVKEQDSPFIIFNCADYTNNPQLLTSQLFGVKKGTYTGADSDKVGLIEKANGGILFLDEVHRLPPEGQEALFTFLDKGTFRRMGDDKIRKSDVLIISATTENPNSALLKTFTRRIPIVITLPSLNERTLKERLHLIKTFFNDESKKINMNISVSLNTMRAFLSYDCPNNIGQLKSDVRLICAKAYSEYLTNITHDVRIRSGMLPLYIREGLYKENEHRILWNELMGDEVEFFKFSGKNTNMEEDKHECSSIYKFIEEKLEKLKSQGISNIDIENILEKDITNYFDKYIKGVSDEINRKNLLTILGEENLNFIDKLIYGIVVSLKRNISNNIYTALALHINTLISRVSRNKNIINPELEKIKNLYPEEYQIALNAKKQIEEFIHSPIADDEAGYLTLFLLNEDSYSKKMGDKVGIIIIAHGDSTATSMAKVANDLLDEDFVVGINCPLDIKPSIVLEKLREVVKNNLTTSGYILLVDMGSLTTFGEVIEKEFNIPVKVYTLVSTLHVIEAARKALLGLSMGEVYNELLSVDSYKQLYNIPEPSSYINKNKYAIITTCLTGTGGSITIKNFLNENLNYDENLFEIIALDCLDKVHLKEKLLNIQMEKEILFIVSSFHIDLNIKQYTMHDILSLKVKNEIQEIIDKKSVLEKMSSAVQEMISTVDGSELCNDIREFVNSVENKLNVKIDDGTLIGIVLHMASSISKLKNGEPDHVYPDKESFIKRNSSLFNIINDNCIFLYNKYYIKFSDDELCYISNFFLQQIKAK